MEGDMDDDVEMPGWEPEPGWASLAVVCPRCGADSGRLCEDRPFTDDPRQTAIPGTGWTRRDPHDERIAEWERRMQAFERRMGWRR